MRVLFDTNVVLDVLVRREPHAGVAARLMALVEHRRIQGLLGATTVTTIHYLAAKAVGTGRARRYVALLLSLFEIAPVTSRVLADALALRFRDYEDAVLHEAARQAAGDGIVTRNAEDFARSRLRVYAPDELLGIVEATKR